MAGRKAIMKPVERMELRLMREAGVPMKEAAAYFNVSMATAMRTLAELRKILGPEKYKQRECRQRARGHLYISQNASTDQPVNH